MKYIKILIITLAFILIGIGIYYVYLVISPPKSNTTLEINNDEATPFTLEQKTGVDPKYRDYTSADLSQSNEPIVINGRFQAIDPTRKEVNMISYSYVLGILDQKDIFSRIWLTTDEYEKISKTIYDNDIFMGNSVVFTLDQNGMRLDKISP